MPDFVKPSPEKIDAVAAIVGLLNSRSHAGLDDTLVGDSAADVLRPFADDPPTARSIRQAGVLRDQLLRSIESPAEHPQPLQEAAALVESVRFVYRPSATGADLRQVSGDPVVGGIVRSVVELLDSGSWSRIKLCANEGCGGAFYDNTRNLSRRWHSYDTCGNRANVSAYRRRAAGDGVAQS